MNHNFLRIKRIRKAICFCVLIIAFSNLQIFKSAAQLPMMKGSWQWVKSIGSSDQSTGYDEKINQMKTDHLGNTYVCGRVYDNGKYQGKNNTYKPLTHWQNSSKPYGFLAKYDCGGDLQWFKYFNDSIDGNEIVDMAIDSAQNVYLMALIGWDFRNIYWNDSLVHPQITSTVYNASETLCKIDKDGRFLWGRNSSDFWGTTTSIGFYVSSSQNIYYEHTPTGMFLRKDTLIIFGGMEGTAGINSSYGTNQILRFNTHTGTLIDTLKLWDNVSGAGIDNVSGYGIDKAGNYYLAAEAATVQNIFMGDTIKAPQILTNGGYKPPVIFCFSHQKLITAKMFLDSSIIISTNFSHLEIDSSFEVAANSRIGGRFVPQYQCNTVKLDPFADSTCYPVYKLKSLNQLEWVINADTVYDGAVFAFPKNDVNGNSYCVFSPDTHTIVQGHFFSTSPVNYQIRPLFLKLSRDSGKILTQSQDLKTTQGNIYSHYATYNDFSVNEKGEITAVGDFHSNRIIAGKDTTTYFGGNNDMFTIKYGFDCNNDSALIEPVAAINLKAMCQTDSVKLTWNDNSNIEWGYHIYRATGSRTATYNLIATTQSNTTIYFDKTIAANTNYWYKVAAYNNVGDGVTTNIDSSMSCKTVGINSINKNNFVANIYPNPTQTGEFTLSVQCTETGKAQLQISNYMGQIILDENVQLNTNNQWHLDLSKYSSGTYLITLKTSSGNFGERVMVVK